MSTRALAQRRLLSPAATPLSSPAKPLGGWAGKNDDPGSASSVHTAVLAAALARWQGYARERSSFRKGLRSHIRQRLRTAQRLALYVWHGVVVAQVAAAQVAADSMADTTRCQRVRAERSWSSKPVLVSVQPPRTEPEPEPEPVPVPMLPVPETQRQHQHQHQHQHQQREPGQIHQLNQLLAAFHRSDDVGAPLAKLATRLELQHREWEEAEQAEEAREAIRRLGARLQAAQHGAAKATAACEAAAERVRQVETAKLAAEMRCQTLERAQLVLQRELLEQKAAEELARRRAAESQLAMRKRHGRQIVAATAWKRAHKLMHMAWQAWLFMADASLGHRSEQQRNEMKRRADADLQLVRESWANAAAVRLEARQLRSHTRRLVVEWGRLACHRSASRRSVSVLQKTRMHAQIMGFMRRFVAAWGRLACYRRDTRRLLAVHQKTRMRAQIIRVMRGWSAAAAQAVKTSRQTEMHQKHCAQLDQVRGRQTLLRVLDVWSLAAKFSMSQKQLSAANYAHEAELLVEQCRYAARNDGLREKMLGLVVSRICDAASREVIQAWQAHASRKLRQRRLLRQGSRNRLRAVATSWHQLVRMRNRHRHRKKRAEAKLCKRHLRVLQEGFYSWHQHIRRCHAAARAGRLMRFQELLGCQTELACVFACSVREKNVLRVAIAGWREQIFVMRTLRQLQLKFYRHSTRVVLVQWYDFASCARVRAMHATRYVTRRASRQLRSCFGAWSDAYRASLRLSSLMCRSSCRVLRHAVDYWRRFHAATVQDAAMAHAAQQFQTLRAGALCRLTERVHNKCLASSFAYWCINWRSARQAAALGRRLELRVTRRALTNWAAAVAQARYRDAVVSAHADTGRELARQKDQFLQASVDQALDRFWHHRLSIILKAWLLWSSTQVTRSRRIGRTLILRQARSLKLSLECWKRIVATKRAVARLRRRADLRAQRRVLFEWRIAALSDNYTSTLLSHMDSSHSIQAKVSREVERVGQFTDRLCKEFLKQRTASEMAQVFHRWHHTVGAGSLKHTRAVVWCCTRISVSQALSRSWVRWRSVVLSAKHTELVARCSMERCGFKLVLQSQRKRLDELKAAHIQIVENREAQSVALSDSELQVAQLQRECKEVEIEAKAQCQNYSAKIAAENTALLQKIKDLECTTEVRKYTEASAAIQRALVAEERASAANDALATAKESLWRAQQQLSDSRADRRVAEAVRDAQVGRDAAELVRLKETVESEQQALSLERSRRKAAEDKYLDAAKDAAALQLKVNAAAANFTRDQAAWQSEITAAAVDAASSVSRMQKELALVQQEGTAAVKVWTQRHNDLESECQANVGKLQAAKSKIHTIETELADMTAKLAQAESKLAEEVRRCDLTEATTAFKVESAQAVCKAALEAERAEKAAIESQLADIKAANVADLQTLRNELMVCVDAERQQKQQLQVHLKDLCSHPEWQGRQERLDLKQQLQWARQRAYRAELVATEALEAAERSRMMSISILKQHHQHQSAGKKEEVIVASTEKQQEQIKGMVVTTGMQAVSAEKREEPTQGDVQLDQACSQAKQTPKACVDNAQKRSVPQSMDEQVSKLVLDSGGFTGLRAVREKLRAAELELGNLRDDVGSKASSTAEMEASIGNRGAAGSQVVSIDESTDVAMSLDALTGVIYTEPFIGAEVNTMHCEQIQCTDDVANELDASSAFEQESDSDDELLNLLNRTRPVPPILSQEKTTSALSCGSGAVHVRKVDTSREQRQVRPSRRTQTFGTRSSISLHATTIGQNDCRQRRQHRQQQHDRQSLEVQRPPPVQPHPHRQDTDMEEQRCRSRRVAIVFPQSTAEPPPMFFVPTLPSGGRSFRRTELSELTLRAECRASQIASRSDSVSAASSLRNTRS